MTFQIPALFKDLQELCYAWGTVTSQSSSLLHTSVIDRKQKDSNISTTLSNTKIEIYILYETLKYNGNCVSNVCSEYNNTNQIQSYCKSSNESIYISREECNKDTVKSGNRVATLDTNT